MLLKDGELGLGDENLRQIFLDAPGGCGKTLLCRVIAAHVRSQGKVVLCVGSTGIAASNYERGGTAHNVLKLPFEIFDGQGVWNVTNGSQRAHLIRQAAVLIYDEVSMVHRFLIEIADRSLRDLMQNSKPFGGKVILFVGDLRQLAPIVPNARTPHDVISVSIRSSFLWMKLKRMYLTTMQRARGHHDYADFLLQVGNGTLPERTFEDGAKLVPLTHIQPLTSLDSLLLFVFPPEVWDSPDELSKRAILSTHNVNVKAINQILLSNIEGEVVELRSADYIPEGQDTEGLTDIFDSDLLNQATAPGVPDHLLHLKVGAVCLVNRNLHQEEGLVNGTKVIIVAIHSRLVVVRRPGSDVLIGIPRILFKFPVVNNSHVMMCRRQFPLQLAFAMSIHKAQGQTVQVCGLDLRSDPFAHGQLYVGTSRPTSPEGIRVLVHPDRVVDGVAYVKNIVYRDLLC